VNEPEPLDLVGAHEIARRLQREYPKLRPISVRRWSHRQMLPPPDLIADSYGRKLWLWETVETRARQLAERYR
jgi:hypothetical protein